MQEIYLKEEDCLSDDEVKELAGTYLDERHYDEDKIVRDDAVIYKPDGTILAVFCKGLIPKDLAKKCFEQLQTVGGDMSNRGNATQKGTHKQNLLADGTLSQTNRINLKENRLVQRNGSKSGVIGYYDRYVRIPYCRQTAFNEKNYEGFKIIYPMIKMIDNFFKRAVPDRYALQRAEADKTSKDFVITDTSFTTVTVNRNWQTACHTDRGDFEKGFGNLACLRSGEYSGGYTIFPKYRCGVDLGSRDVALLDVHQWHGNTRIKGARGKFKRISIVCYYRKKMIECGTAEQELERAKVYGSEGVYSTNLNEHHDGDDDEA